MSIWSQDSENQLLSEAALGNSEAFSKIYDRYASPLFSFALRMLGSRGDAEEVVQDVFCSVWKQASTFDSSQAKLFTWMTAMTRNRCIDRLRAKGSRITTSEELENDPGRVPKQSLSKDVERNAAEQLISKEEFDLLRSALLELPLEQKDVLELAFLSGWTHSEIAEKRNLSLGTVKARIRYGLGKLRNRYASQQ